MPKKVPTAYTVTQLKDDISKLIRTKGKNLGVYETVGALEVVKTNLLEGLGQLDEIRVNFN